MKLLCSCTDSDRWQVLWTWRTVKQESLQKMFDGWKKGWVLRWSSSGWLRSLYNNLVVSWDQTGEDKLLDWGDDGPQLCAENRESHGHTQAGWRKKLHKHQSYVSDDRHIWRWGWAAPDKFCTDKIYEMVTMTRCLIVHCVVFDYFNKVNKDTWETSCPHPSTQ